MDIKDSKEEVEREDKLKYRPQPHLLDKALTNEDELEDEDEEEEDEDIDQVVNKKYTVPKTNPVYFEDKAEKKKKRELEHKRRKLAKSDVVQEMRRDLADEPEEIDDNPYAKQMVDEEEDRIEKQEEDMFQRISLTREQKRNIKQKRKSLEKGLHNLLEEDEDLKQLKNFMQMEDEGDYAEVQREQDKEKLKRSLNQYLSKASKKKSNNGATADQISNLVKKRKARVENEEIDSDEAVGEVANKKKKIVKVHQPDDFGNEEYSKAKKKLQDKKQQREEKLQKVILTQLIL